MKYTTQPRSAAVWITGDTILPKSNLKTLAYIKIREKIVTCEYAPGSNLNEEMLTSVLGLSRTPVRDALSRLEQEGLVEIRPKKGITVTPLTLGDINMIFELRMLYEPYIILTCGHLIPRDSLQKYLKIFETPPEGGFRSMEASLRSYALDEEFHAMIMDACPNVYIRRGYEQIRTQNERFRHMTGTAYEKRLETSYLEHLAILKACIAGDYEGAAEEMRKHIQASKEAAITRAFEHMEQGI